MLRRLAGLFERYCAENLVISCPGLPLVASEDVVGEVIQIVRRGNRLEVAGWARANLVTLQWGDDRVSDTPRPDAGDPAVSGRFSLDMPVGEGALLLHLSGVRGEPFALPQISPRTLARARLRLLPRFALGLLRAMPLILRWAVRRDPALRPQIRAAIGFRVLTSAQKIEPGLFARRGASASPSLPGVTCVVPVYDGFSLLPEVLERVARNTDLPWHLVLIEDASPDPAVRPFLRDWAAKQNTQRADSVTLLENPANLGFVGSVNRGLDAARARGGPVILLNADAFVPPGWARRLIAPLLQDAGVASTTPMSNDAEIFSVPAICTGSALAPGAGEAIDARAQGFAPGVGDVAVPTGVGFCMALAPDWLEKVPQFDTAFGRGYGEEVDWCQKIRALGGRHLGVANLFVEHRGGTSFGSEEKRRLIAANSNIISTRYPRYDIEVQDFLRADPLITPRLALAVAWLAAQAGTQHVPVYLVHAMGGGAEYYQSRRLAGDIARQGGAIVLRVGTALRWRLEVHSAAGVITGASDDFSLIKTLLAPLTRRTIVYGCAVGDTDPLTIPDHLLDLAAMPSPGQAEIEVLFHDFFPLTPSFNLLGQDGIFHGVPQDDCKDSAHQTRRPDSSIVSLVDWRAAWGRLIARADRIVVFSTDSAAHVQAVWPAAAPRIAVVPHHLHHGVARIAPRPAPKPVVGILGNINRQKGSALIAVMAGATAKTGDLSFMLIGDVDPSLPMPHVVGVHGEYRLQDLPVLVRRYRITAWLVPSLWPETFSYATHEVLATGLPVFCLDMGAQGEAVRTAARSSNVTGHIIARHPTLAAQADATLEHLRAVLLPGA